MRIATMIALVTAVAALPACKNDQAQDQNIVMDNGVMANADIEALPPDESSATPSNELASGADNPEVNDLNASTNSY